MCGIFAFIGAGIEAEKLYECLCILQNRGYDSAGMSSIINNKFLLHKYAGDRDRSPFDLLKPHIQEHSRTENFISHVRYSCIGVPSDRNSHPHIDYTGKFSLVHNGIIENYSLLKKELSGINFSSDTDSEVIVNLLGYYYDQTNQQVSKKDRVRTAIEKTLNRLEGTWGLVIQCLDEPNKLYVARNGSPLLIGLKDDFVMVASEQSGFSNHVSDYISLRDGDIIEITKDNQGKVLIDDNTHELHKVNSENFVLTPDPFPHWTLKEIHEQFEASLRTMGMGSRIKGDRLVKLNGLDGKKDEIIDVDHLIVLGCGTSYHAGLYVVPVFKKISGFHTVQIFDGAEFNHHDISSTGKSGLILLSQSGETKDLHRCIDIAKERDLVTIGVINVVDSAIARDVDCGVYLNAGKEMGVASTKSFTSQVIALSMIACWFSQNRNINESERIDIIKSLSKLPYDINDTIKTTSEECKTVAEYLSGHNSGFLLGKGQNKAIAMEGALKIKEIGYLNTNGYSTSSLKHGSYALIEEGFPTIILLPDDAMFQRNNSVGEELKSRQSFVISITDRDDTEYLRETYDININIPHNKEFFGVLSNICLQLIAYNVAVIKGNRVDRPRNLCKSVTVD